MSMTRKMGLWLFTAIVLSFSISHSEARVVEGIVGRGEAAVVGITADEAQLLALQRARADAIEQAAGINVLGSTLIKDFLMVSQFLKTFSRGFIVKEEVSWDGRMIPQGKGPPLANYTAEIRATVMVPERKVDPGFNLEATLDGKGSYVAGEHAVIRAKVTRKAYLGVFNLRADDKVMMLCPSRRLGKESIFSPNEPFLFPPSGSGLVLEVATLQGHKRDSEAFIVIAVPAEEGKPFRFTDHFEEEKSYSVPQFFERYSRFVEHAVEAILPYEVREKGN